MNTKGNFNPNKTILSEKNEEDIANNIAKGLLPKATLIHSPVVFLPADEISEMEEDEI